MLGLFRPTAVVVALLANARGLLQVGLDAQVDPVPVLLRFVAWVVLTGAALSLLQALLLHYARGHGRAVPRRRAGDRPQVPSGTADRAAAGTVGADPTPAGEEGRRRVRG